MLPCCWKWGHPSRLHFPLHRINWPTQSVTIILTEDFFVGRVAETIKKYGPTHAKSRFVLDLLDKFIDRGADFRCHCSAKNAHYCAISEAFKHLRFVTSEGNQKCNCRFVPGLQLTHPEIVIPRCNLQKSQKLKRLQVDWNRHSIGLPFD